MSETVDKRIVELDFDNNKFKKGISDTLEGMKKLNGAFNMKEAVSNIDELDSSIRKVDPSSMAKGVEKVRAEFSLMGAVAFSAINKITTSLIDMGSQMASAVTIKPLTDGLDEYALKMNSITTIKTNTNRSLEDISNTLSELNDYADKTIYNFADMTKYVGTFTASGVGLEQSADAIKGIANLAASAGSNAQQASSAMYNLSQSLATGRLQLIDWKSVQNAGMGGQLFQNALLRTSEAMGTGGAEAIEKMGSFNESLSEGWVTAEVLTETLHNFTLATNDMTEAQEREARATLKQKGYNDEQIEQIFREANAAQDAATKVKTFQQLVDTTQEALGSGWAQTWEYIIGDIEEAEEFFTAVSDATGSVIQEMTNARNELLREWHDNGGRDALVEGFFETFGLIADIVRPIKDAFNDVFKPLNGSELAEGTKNLTSFIKGLRQSLRESEYAKVVFDSLKVVFTALSKAISVVGTVVPAVLGAVGNAIRLVWDVASGFFGAVFSWIDGLGVFDKLSEFFDMFNGFLSNAKVEVPERLGAGFRFLQESLAGISDKIGPVFTRMLDGLSEAKDRVFEFVGALNLKDKFSGVVNAVRNVKLGLPTVDMSGFDGFLGQAKGVFSGVGEFLRDKFAIAFENVKDIWNGFLPVLSGFSEQIKNFWENLVKNVSEANISFEGFKNFIQDIYENLKDVFSNGLPIDGLINGIKSVKDNITDTFGALTGLTDREHTVDISMNVDQKMNGEPVKSGIANPVEAVSSFVGYYTSGNFASDLGNNDQIVSVMDVPNQIATGISSLAASAKTLANPVQVVKDFFGNAVPTALTTIGNEMSSALSKVPTEDIMKFTKDISGIATSAMVVWGGFAIDQFITKAGVVLDNVGTLIKSAAGLLDGLKAAAKTLSEGAAKAMKLNALSGVLISLGVFFAALAAAVWILSTVPDPMPIIGVLAGVSVLLMVLMSCLSKMEMFNPAAVTSIAVLFGAVAGAFLSFGLAVKLIAGIKEEDFEKAKVAMIALTSIVVLVGLLSALIGEVSSEGLKGAAVILSFVIALKVLMGVFKELGSMDVDQATAGFQRLFMLLLMLAVPIALMGVFNKQIESAGLILLEFAVALVVLSAAFKIMERIDIESTLASIALLVVGLLALGLATKLLAAMNLPSTLMKAAFSMVLLAAAMILMAKAVSMIVSVAGGDVGAVAVALIALAGGLVALGLALKLAGGPRAITSALGILIVCGALSALLAMIFVMSHVPWGDLAVGLGVFAAAIIGLVVLAAVVSAFVVPLNAMNITLLVLGQALMLISGSFALFVATIIGAGLALPYVLQGLIDAFNMFKEELQGQEESFIAFCETMGRGLGRFIIGFLDEVGNAIGEWLTTVSIPIGDFLLHLGDEIVKGITFLWPKILEGLKWLADEAGKAMANLMGDACREGVSSINPEMQDFYDNHMDTQAVQNAGHDQGEAMAQGTQEGIQENKDGIVQAAGDAGDEAGQKLVESASQSAEEGLDINEQEMIENAIDPEAGSAVVDEQIKAMMEQAGMDPAIYEEQSNNIGQMFGMSLPEGISSGLGDFGPDKMFSMMHLDEGSMVPGATNLGNEFGTTFNSSVVTSMSESGNLDSGVNAQVEALKSHEEEYKQVGSDYANNVADGFNETFAESSVDEALNGITEIFSEGEGEAEESGSRMGNAFVSSAAASMFTSSFVVSSMVRGVINTAYEESGADQIGSDAGVRSADGLMRGVNSKQGDITSVTEATLIKASEDSDPGGKGFQTGEWFDEGTSTGVESKTDDVSNAISSMVSDASDGSGAYDKGYSVGESMGDGMVAGINSKKDEIRSASNDAGQASADGFADGGGVKSPSWKTMRVARFMAEGMIIGLRKYSANVYKVAENLGSTAADATGNGVSLLGSLFEDVDWDSEPVITPVLDLEELSRGVGRMNGMFNDNNVLAAGYANRVLGSQSGSVQNVQNGGNTTIYMTLDWKAGTTPNQMLRQMASELETWNLTKGE